ncbi:MAG TPA: IS21 family transposase, partial [Thermoclostridium sp.]|nr:IS21 family transposase [Thermoclostridium sp.]
IEWAENIGPSTLTIIQYILDTNQTEKLALQSIFSLKKSERHYTKYEIERACKMVISATKRPTVKSVQTLLKNNKKNDAEKALKHQKEVSENSYGFTRGASYYGGGDE